MLDAWNVWIFASSLIFTSVCLNKMLWGKFNRKTRFFEFRMVSALLTISYAKVLWSIWMWMRKTTAWYVSCPFYDIKKSMTWKRGIVLIILNVAIVLFIVLKWRLKGATLTMLLWAQTDSTLWRRCHTSNHSYWNRALYNIGCLCWPHTISSS